jgi:hypothetical protein
MNIKVVTSIVGNGRDKLTNKIVKEENVEYVAYTEQQSDLWTVKPPCNIFNENKKNAKIHKILIHQYEPCDVSIWMDGNVDILKPPTQVVNELLGDADIAICRHPKRINELEEGAHIIKEKVEYEDIVLKQLKKYKEDILYTPDLLCFATVLIRRHTKEVEAFNNYWWSEITTGSFRDQISLPYVISKHKLKYNIFSNKQLNENFLRAHHSPILYT